MTPRYGEPPGVCPGGGHRLLRGIADDGQVISWRRPYIHGWYGGERKVSQGC
jgi:hypothetical protein